MPRVVAADGEVFRVRSGGQIWLTSWHGPPDPPAGTPHGASGICMNADRNVVLISGDGKSWDFPAGRPEGSETWGETLRREMMEEACAEVLRAKLLGFSRGACVEGHERGLVLVRSIWLAEVALMPWAPQFEMPYRLVVPADEVLAHLDLDAHPFGPILLRGLREAGLA